MALQKLVEFPTGYSASYWRIMEILVSYQSSTCSVVYAGYKDEATRRTSPTDGRLVVRTASYGLDPSWVPAGGDVTRDMVYRQLKQREVLLAGAVDV